MNTVYCIHKDGTYYIPTKRDYSLNNQLDLSDWQSILVDGVPLAQTYRTDFVSLLFDPSRSTWVKTQKKTSRTTGYVLKGDFPASDAMPRTLAPGDLDHRDACDLDYDSFAGCAVGCRKKYATLYDATTETFTPAPIELDVQVVILDSDCAPLAEQKYSFTSDWPHQLTFPGMSLHKYPCSANVYGIVWNHLRKGLPNGCFFDRWMAIGLRQNELPRSIEVHRAIPALHEETTLQSVEIPSRKRTKDTAWIPRPLRTIDATVLSMKIETDAVIRGKNYEDLEARIDRYLADLDAYLSAPFTICTSCKGYGIHTNKDARFVKEDMPRTT